jgi:plastocyanin
VSREVRSRIVLGIGIPLAAFLFLAALILAFSRILLAVPEELAPWVALLFAATILTGCALAATVRGTRGFAFLIGVLVLTIVGGGAVGLALGERPVEALVEEEAGPPAGEAAPPAGAPPEEGMPPPPPPGEAGGGGGPAGVVTIVAQGIAFDTSEIALPAGGEATIDFDNRDAGIPHNVAISPEDGGEAVFQGEIITGPATVTYRFPSPGPGQYRFQCDVHPQMAGTVAVG